MIEKILVIRPGGIGDAIFLLPILRCIRAHRPEIKIDVLCEKRNAEIFRSQDGLCNNVLCYDNFSDNVECSPRARFGYPVPTCGVQYQCMKDLQIHKYLEI